MVNFMSTLLGHEVCRHLVKYYSVSVRVFLGEINNWINE